MKSILCHAYGWLDRWLNFYLYIIISDCRWLSASFYYCYYLFRQLKSSAISLYICMYSWFFLSSNDGLLMKAWWKLSFILHVGGIEKGNFIEPCIVVIIWLAINSSFIFLYHSSICLINVAIKLCHWYLFLFSKFVLDMWRGNMRHQNQQKKLDPSIHHSRSIINNPINSWKCLCGVDIVYMSEIPRAISTPLIA